MNLVMVLRKRKVWIALLSVGHVIGGAVAAQGCTCEQSDEIRDGSA